MPVTRFSIRQAEAEEGGKKKEKEKDKAVPAVFAFPPEIAPYKAVVLPLDGRVAKDYAALLASTRAEMNAHGLQYKVDESSAPIGRRYARADELGIPFAITIDFDTLGQSKDSADAAALTGTATVRERDSTGQVRLPVGEIPAIIARLVGGRLAWADLYAAHGIGADGKPAGGGGGLGGDGSEAMLAYLAQHGVAGKLNDAVNALAAAKPDDPMAFLVAQLSK
jgi:glycyl-tRNA synthetase